MNPFYAQINKKHLRKAEGYSGRNIVEKNNKDEDNSPKTLTDKNHQALSQKFRQLYIMNNLGNFLVFFRLLSLYVSFKQNQTKQIGCDSQ